MPLYMDVHTIDGGVSAADVEKAHLGRPGDAGHARRALPALLGRRVARQGLLPGRGAVRRRPPTTVHREAHGLVADDVFQVQEGA